MANTLYPKGKEKMLQAQINWLTDSVRAALVDAAYVYAAAHEFLTDLGANVLATVAVSGRSVTSGVFDLDDPVFTTVASGDTAAYVVFYKNTGVDATSPLLYYADTITNFPVATNGANITAIIDNGPYKLFSL